MSNFLEVLFIGFTPIMAGIIVSLSFIRDLTETICPSLLTYLKMGFIPTLYMILIEKMIGLYGLGGTMFAELLLFIGMVVLGELILVAQSKKPKVREKSKYETEEDLQWDVGIFKFGSYLVAYIRSCIILYPLFLIGPLLMVGNGCHSLV